MQCPCCGEIAHRVKRRWFDRIVSLFKRVKRYKCDFCDWEGSIVSVDLKRQLGKK